MVGDQDSTQGNVPGPGITHHNTVDALALIPTYVPFPLKLF